MTRAILACMLIIVASVVARADEYAGASNPGASNPGYAGASNPGYAGDRAAAERAFRAGEKAYAAQNFGAAAVNFDVAFKALPLPEIAFSAAQAYRRQFRIEPKLEYAQKAVAHYRYYLDRVKSGGRVGVAADALGEMIREVEKRSAEKVAPVAVVEFTRLAISPQVGEKRGGLREIADLPEVSAQKILAMIDGKPVPAYEMVDVEPGEHAVHVEVDGYLVFDKVERAVKGDSRVVEFTMSPKPGRIRVKTMSGARVRVDGRIMPAWPAGRGPMSFEVPAGKHLVTVQRSGRETVEREVEVARGQEIVFEQPLKKTPRRRAVPYVFAGAAAMGVITISGLLLAVQLDGGVDDQLALIRAGDQRPEALADYRSKVSRRDEVATGTWITGGLTLGIVAAAGALLWFDRPDDEGTRLTPIVGPGQAGATFRTRF